MKENDKFYPNIKYDISVFDISVFEECLAVTGHFPVMT